MRLINRPRRGETPLHYSTKLGAVRCTDILLRKGARLTENGEDPPVVPPVIELAVEKRYAPILDTVSKIKQINPDMGYLSDHEIMSTLQKKDGTSAFLFLVTVLKSVLELRKISNSFKFQIKTIN